MAKSKKSKKSRKKNLDFARQFKSSGLTQSEFAAQNDIDESELEQWLEQLNEQEAEGTSESADESSEVDASTEADASAKADASTDETESEVKDAETAVSPDTATETFASDAETESSSDAEVELSSDVEKTESDATPTQEVTEDNVASTVEYVEESNATSKETVVNTDSSHLGPYELRGELGRGAMAIVWRAYDPKLEREVAIKEPLFDTRLAPEVLEEMGARFVKEGKAAARLNHPGIITIYAADVYDGKPAIVMELVEGQTLSDVIDYNGAMDPQTALAIVIQLLDAIGYAHTQGIVHRDIKPDNIFINTEGRVKLADFGIAHIADSSQTKATQIGTVLGTPGYMAPEQATGAPVDNRTDLFAIGTILYEMLTGKNPFGAGEEGNTTVLLYRIVHEEVSAIPDVNVQGLPVDIRPAVMAALAKNPNERPQTAQVFKEMLGGASLPLVPIAPSKSKNKWLPLAFVGIIGVAAIIVIFFLATSGGGGGGGGYVPTPNDEPTEVAAEGFANEQAKETIDCDVLLIGSGRAWANKTIEYANAGFSVVAISPGSEQVGDADLMSMIDAAQSMGVTFIYDLELMGYRDLQQSDSSSSEGRTALFEDKNAEYTLINVKVESVEITESDEQAYLESIAPKNTWPPSRGDYLLMMTFNHNQGIFVRSTPEVQGTPSQRYGDNKIAYIGDGDRQLILTATGETVRGSDGYNWFVVDIPQDFRDRADQAKNFSGLPMQGYVREDVVQLLYRNDDGSPDWSSVNILK